MGKSAQYCYSDEEKDELVKKLKKEHKDKEPGIQRYKGLGEMNPEQLWDTTMNPGNRKLVKIEMEEEVDAGSYVRRLITYQSEPDSRTPAYLCIPKRALAG